MNSSAVRLVTKMPCRLQKMNEGLTASSNAAAAAASGPPRRRAASHTMTRVNAAMISGSQRSATTFTPPTARKGTASTTLSAPM